MAYPVDLAVRLIERHASGAADITVHKRLNEFYYSVGLSKDVKYKAEAAV